jgi:hypothetical protein
VEKIEFRLTQKEKIFRKKRSRMEERVRFGKEKKHVSI